GGLIDQHGDLAIEHRHVDIGADAFLAHLLHGGERADHRIEAGRQISEWNASAHRPATPFARHAHAAGHRLRDDVVGRPVAIGPGLTEPRNGADDDFRIYRLERLVVEAEAGGDARAEIFKHDVGAADEIEHDGATTRGLEIDREAFLVAVHRKVV